MYSTELISFNCINIPLLAPIKIYMSKPSQKANQIIKIITAHKMSEENLY